MSDTFRLFFVCQSKIVSREGVNIGASRNEYVASREISIVAICYGSVE